MSAAKHTQGKWVAVGTWVECARDDVADICVCGPSIFGQGKMGRSLDEARANARLIACAPELLAVAQEAVRIEQARLVLVDGLDDKGEPFTQAQKLDARAFLSKRRADWLHEAAATIAQATRGAS